MEDGNGNLKKEDDNEDVETVAVETSKAPDGGWGWCIILGILILRTVIGGFVRSHGLFYLRFKERFGGTATATSLVTSLSSFMRLSTGPIVSILSGRFQCRIITAIGVVVLATGVIMTAFSPNISFLYFSYGIVCGFGRSLVLTPCPILLGYYFDKRRSLAFGIASAGFSIGGFALTPLVELLFQEYGIQGTFLILTAMSMHIFISCTLFRPIESNRRSVTNSKNKNRADTEAEYDKLLVTSKEVCKRPDHAYHETSNNSDVLNSGVLNSDVLNSDVLNSDVLNSDVLNSDVLNSDVLNSDVLNSDGLNSDVLNSDVHNRDGLNSDVLNSDVLNSDGLNSDVLNSDVLNSDVLNSDVLNNDVLNSDVHNRDVLSSDVLNSDVLNSDVLNDDERKVGVGSEKENPRNGNVIVIETSGIQVNNVHKETPNKYQDVINYESDNIAACYRDSESICETELTLLHESQTALKSIQNDQIQEKEKPKKRKWISWSILKNPRFVCYVLSMFCFTLPAGGLFLPALAKSRGCTDIQAATLMSINAASDTVFRVISGFVLDLKMFRNNRPIIYNIITFFQAAALLCFPFMENFSGFTFLCVIDGLFNGAKMAQGSVVLIDILGVDKMASSLAVSMAVQCFAVIIGPTVSGRLVDIYDGYSVTFFFGGGALFVGGLILVVGNVINTIAIKREQKIKNTDL